MPPLAPAPDPNATPAHAWGLFALLVLGMLALDLFVFNRRAHIRGVRDAAIWCGVWVALALGFGVCVYEWKGEHAAVDFATAYCVEQALSVDNLFIFLIIFRYFGVPTVFQHRVLFWGVLGAQVLRGIMIFAGVELIQRFHAVLFLFAGFLIFTGIKLFFGDDASHDPSKTWAFRICKKLMPMTDRFHEERFTIVEAGKRLATPLLLVLVVIEATDLAFAVDSIPACLAISKDAFVVYTSNIFAVMGLRAYYFLLAGMMSSLRFLKPALSIILVFIGAKMILAEGWDWKMDNKISLGIVAGILALSVLLSRLLPGKPPAPAPMTTLPSSADLPSTARPPEAQL
ncbi:MAG: TerC family protein [Planctomycetes bacterium]|nr:TerC family protein [Planctomycetota bacterium]